MGQISFRESLLAAQQGANQNGNAEYFVITTPNGIVARAQNQLLFDTETFISGTTTGLTFFQNASVDGSGVLSKRPGIDTSMTQNGILPNGYLKQLTGVSVFMTPITGTGTAAYGTGTGTTLLTNTSWQNLLNRAELTLTLSSTVFFRGQLNSIPSTIGHHNNVATQAASTLVNTHYVGSGFSDNPWPIYGKNGGPIPISPQQNFKVEINWVGAVTLTDSVPDADPRVLITVSLHGPLYIPAQ